MKYQQLFDKATYANEVELITLAHVLIAQGQADSSDAHLSDATNLLERLHYSAQAGGRMGRVIEIKVLQAIAYPAQNQKHKALTALEEALIIAERQGYMRIFLDKAPQMAPLFGLLSSEAG